jgi:hypothetical protein
MGVFEVEDKVEVVRSVYGGCCSTLAEWGPLQRPEPPTTGFVSSSQSQAFFERLEEHLPKS